jgi:hypothetical protein
MPKFVKTGENGRLELHGIGRERVVLLHIEGPGIEYRAMTVITRNGPAKEMPSGLHGAAINHLAACATAAAPPHRSGTCNITAYGSYFGCLA